MVDETQGMVETMTDKLTIADCERLIADQYAHVQPYEPILRAYKQLADTMRENERLLEELNKCYEDFDDEFSTATSEKDRNYFKIRMAEINSFLNPNKDTDNG